jgi:O-antigen/teichoic acid export membrane protein
MTSTLKHQAISASFWSAIDAFARQGLQFGITVILARLLTPSDYGTVALLSIFIGFASVFISSGFSTALIQRKDVTDVDLSSVFYFNIVIALILSSTLCVSAPWIAEFYNQPILTSLTRLLALGLFLGSFGSIQSTMMTKALDFRKQCIISIASVLVSGTVAIILALRAYGVWSLAFSSLTSTCVTTCLLWLLNTWRPRLIFSVAAIRSLFRFGSFLFISGLIDLFYTRLNTLVIGKFYSPRDLGYYSRADGTQQLPANLLTGIINRVTFPVFATIHHDTMRLRAGLRKTIGLVMMVNIPVMFGLAVTSKLLVLVLFGEKWLPCVPYLRILCIGGTLFPMQVLNLNILVAQGHSNLFFRLEVIKKAIGVSLLVFACFWSITAMAWSIVVTSVICFVLNTRYSGLFLGYGTLQQSLDLIPYFGAGFGMAICAWGAGLLVIHPPILLLMIQVLAGITAYGLTCYAFRFPAFSEAIQIIGSRLQTVGFFNRPPKEN